MSDYTVAVDFDGVIHSYTSGWQGAHVCSDPPVEGAIEWLTKTARKFTVVILTTRGDQEGGNEAVMEYLYTWGYDGPPLLVTSKKIPALVYIDDRAYRFTGPDSWPDAHMIHSMRPWNKPPALPSDTRGGE